MKTSTIILLSILGLLLIIGLTFGLGYTGALYTRTVVKTQQNSERKVFEETQSYVQGKRQELIKLHHEWMNANADEKLAIESTIRISFANFDENKINEPELYSFLKKIKYK